MASLTIVAAVAQMTELRRGKLKPFIGRAVDLLWTARPKPREAVAR
jgi:hypothetical protein